MYHFLSGYTARVAGTEVGLGKRAAGDLLDLLRRAVHAAPADRIRQDARRAHRQSTAPNAGWSTPAGRAAPTAPGSAWRSRHTRALLRAALDGRLASAPMRKDPNFGFLVPESAADVPADVLDPRATWANKKAYDETARDLTPRFRAEFRRSTSRMSAARSRASRSAPRPKPSACGKASAAEHDVDVLAVGGKRQKARFEITIILVRAASAPCRRGILAPAPRVTTSRISIIIARRARRHRCARRAAGRVTADEAARPPRRQGGSYNRPPPPRHT